MLAEFGSPQETLIGYPLEREEGKTSLTAV